MAQTFCSPFKRLFWETVRASRLQTMVKEFELKLFVYNMMLSSNSGSALFALEIAMRGQVVVQVRSNGG